MKFRYGNNLFFKVKSTLLIMQNINVTVTLLKIRILTSLWHFSRVGTLFRLLISLWHFFKRMYITQNINVAVILLRVRIYTENLSAWGSVKNLCKSSGDFFALCFDTAPLYICKNHRTWPKWSGPTIGKIFCVSVLMGGVLNYCFNI